MESGRWSVAVEGERGYVTCFIFCLTVFLTNCVSLPSVLFVVIALSSSRTFSNGITSSCGFGSGRVDIGLACWAGVSGGWSLSCDGGWGVDAACGRACGGTIARCVWAILSAVLYFDCCPPPFVFPIGVVSFVWCRLSVCHKRRSFPSPIVLCGRH
jgi:hypothetical protein